MTHETLRTQIKSTLPLIGTQINDPEFVKNTAEQLGNFLDNPVSLTVSMSPEKQSLRILSPQLVRNPTLS